MLIVENKKARFDYELSNHLVAGLKLQGWEVKSIRARKFSMQGAHVRFVEGKPYLFGLQITPLETAGTHVETDKDRPKLLLVHKRQAEVLSGIVQQQGRTIVPESLQWVDGLVKATIAVGKGRTHGDKRELVKQRDGEREQRQVIKSINSRSE